MIPTPASAAAGNTSSTGLSRKALAMIWTVATRGPGDRGEGLLDLLHAHPVGGDRALLDQGVERVVHSSSV